MSTALSTTKEVVNGIWSIGKEIYGGVKEEIDRAIDEETISRVRKNHNMATADELTIKSSSAYQIERASVKKDARDVGVKGGLMLLGINLLFG